jgi:hypothetical protein
MNLPNLCYLCLEFRYQFSSFGKYDEKGIRCKTGAVPAAVSPKTESESIATVRQKSDGKVQITGRARRPAEMIDLLFAFGKNSKDEKHLIFIHSHYSTESLLINY